MKIEPSECVACEACVPYCPVGAIAASGGEVRVDQDRCVECGVCLRARVCPTEALQMPPLDWPRSVRAAFSDPTTPHRGTDEGGRGTEEMKTNDVTGHFGRGVAGMAIEMGRPGVGASFVDIQKMTRAVAQAGASFAPVNPVTRLIRDQRTGDLDPDVLGERVLSAIVEFSIPAQDVGRMLTVVRRAAQTIETVFSLDLIGRVEQGGRIPVLAAAQKAGFAVRPNCKTNVGLGRPLHPE